MAKFTVNSTRFDPYLGYKFKVRWDGKYVAGLTRCSALTRVTETVPWYEGGDSSGPHILPAKTRYNPVTLEAGVTHDTAFEEWANKVNNYQGDAAMSLATFRKDITIEICNQQGNVVLAYNLFRCWVSQYTAMSQLDASSNAVLISSIQIENEGWARDTSVPEPKET